MTHARQDSGTRRNDDDAIKSITNVLMELGKVPINEVEARISEQMYKWQKDNNKVLLNKEDMDNFINGNIWEYGGIRIPREVIKIIAPRMVKDDTKKMFGDLT
jgi:hypothetical protein